MISGYINGNVGPEDLVTRAQFAKMVASAFGLADDNVAVFSPFLDLGQPDEYLYPQRFVAALYGIGAISGTTPEEFSPWAPITRAQMVTVVIRSLQTLDSHALSVAALGAKSVVGDIGSIHTQPLATAQLSGLLRGIDGYGASWNPWAAATRGEAAQMLANCLDLN